MISDVRRAWDRFHEAKGRAEGACAVATELKQPALAKAREVAITELREVGEAFAALERAQMKSGIYPEELEGMHDAFWRWAQAQLQSVMA